MGNRLVVTNIVIKMVGGQPLPHKSQKTVPLFEGEPHAQSADTPLHRDWFSQVIADNVHSKSIFKSIGICQLGGA